MKKIFLLLAMLLGCALPAAAQFDLVTGQVVDPNGVPYSGATMRAQLVTTAGSPVTGTPTVTNANQAQCISAGLGNAPCQMPFPGTNSVTLDPAGNIPGGGLNLAHNPSVTPAGTQWLFSVTISPGIPPPAGTGPQSFSVAITVNATPLAIGATLSAAAPKLSNSSGGTGQTTLTNTVDMMNPTFGMKADLRTCIGTAATLTGASTSFSCATGAFCNGGSISCPSGQTSDVGKRINGTNGCCNASVPVNANTQIIPNNTTISTVNSATNVTLSAASVNGGCTGTNCYIFWATDDDTAVAAADTAYQNSPTCSVLLFPPTPFLVKNPHFNSPNAQCEQLESSGATGRAPTGSYAGWGSNDSVMYLDSTLNSNIPCPTGGSNACFFGYIGTHVRHLGISGGWNQVPNGGGHSYVLTSASSAEWLDVRLVGFSAGDGTTIGFLTGQFSNFIDIFLEGFGFNGLSTSGQSEVFRGGYFGNTQGTSAGFGGSPGTANVTTYGVQFGTAGNSTVAISGGPWNSYGDLIYANSGTCVNANAAAGVALYFDGTTIGSNGSCGTGILDASGSTVVVKNLHMTSLSLQLNMSGSSTFIDGGNNIFSGAGTWTVGAPSRVFVNPTSTYANQTGLVPTCTFTSGGGTTPSCSLQAGSTNEKGVIIATTGTGAPGSAGTVTLTFVGTYTGPTGGAPACVFSLDNSGTAWGAEAVAFTNTQSTTAPVMAWTNIAAVTLTALTASSPYRIGYTCTPR